MSGEDQPGVDDAGAVDGGVCSQRRPVIAFRADARCASSPRVERAYQTRVQHEEVSTRRNYLDCNAPVPQQEQAISATYRGGRFTKHTGLISSTSGLGAIIGGIHRAFY